MMRETRPRWAWGAAGEASNEPFQPSKKSIQRVATCKITMQRTRTLPHMQARSPDTTTRGHLRKARATIATGRSNRDESIERAGPKDALGQLVGRLSAVRVGAVWRATALNKTSSYKAATWLAATVVDDYPRAHEGGRYGSGTACVAWCVARAGGTAMSAVGKQQHT